MVGYATGSDPGKRPITPGTVIAPICTFIIPNKSVNISILLQKRVFFITINWQLSEIERIDIINL